MLTDDEGVTWTVIEAYDFVPTTANDHPAATANRLSLVWFENATGRTASMHLPAGLLASVTDEDLLAFLRVATERKGRQPG